MRSPGPRIRMFSCCFLLLFLSTRTQSWAGNSADVMSTTGDFSGSWSLAPTPDPLFATSSQVHHQSLPRRFVPPSHAPTPVFPTDRPLVTHETTFTYFTTRFLGDSTTILTRKQTITNYEIDSLVKPTRPLIVTRTVVRARESSPTPDLVTNRPEIWNEEHMSEIALTPSLLIRPHAGHDPLFTLVPDSHHPEYPITPTPVTYYTTFTYFTTELEHGHPVTHSREQVISTVIRGKVLPTRVRSRADRSKRNASPSGNQESRHQQPNADGPAMLEEGSIRDPIPTAVHDNDPVAGSNIKVHPTIQDGILSLGSGPETVHLGRRSFGKSTTEVNLAMETYLRLDGITSAVIESMPTSVPDSLNRPTTPLPDVSSIRGSIVSHDLNSGSSRTPEIPSSNSRVLIRTRKPLRPATGETSVRTDILRSRVPSSGRPGLRVRVRPTPVVSSAVTSSTTASSTSVPEDVVSENPAVTTESQLTAGSEPTTPPVVELDSSRVETDLTPSPSRKRVAVTVTRRPFGGLNRLRTRTRSVIRNSATDSISPVVASVTPVTTVSQSSNRVPSRFRVASRVIRPNFSSVSLNPNEQPEPPLDYPSSPVVTQITPTESVEHTPVTHSREWESSLKLPPSESLRPESPAEISLFPSSDLTHFAKTPVLVTYFTTTTHTIPFTVGDKTLFTTFEMTNSRVATETLPVSAPHPTVLSVEPTKTQSLPDASSVAPSFESVDLEINTMFTTFTFFTTFFNGDSSTIRSSEKVVSNIVTTTRPAVRPTEPIHVSRTEPVTSSSASSAIETPVIVVETSDKIATSTIYSTQTFFATLFNGNSSTITPIEETKTEYLTLREPVTITRTVPLKEPIAVTPSSLYSRTYYTTTTSPTTFIRDNQLITSNVQKVDSSVVTFTIPASSVHPSLSEPLLTSTSIVSLNHLETDSLPQPDPSLLTTRSTHTTLTHYITLYSGTNTVLSSVTEISPTVVTEIVGFTPFNKQSFLQQNSIQRTHNAVTSQNRLITSFVPSLSTHVMTHTYFTTLFSGTTSFVSSRSEVATSLVTLYVPNSASDQSRTSAPIQPSTTLFNLEPSLVAEPKITEKPDTNYESTTTAKEKETTTAVATSESATTTSEAVTDESPATTKQPATEAPPTTPAAVIDLEDILSGSGGNKKINENLGAAIKDIVQLLAAAGRQNSSAAGPDIGKTPQPVYIPSLEDSRPSTDPTPVLSPIEEDLAPVFRPDTQPDPLPFLEPSVGSSAAPSAPTPSSSLSPIQTPALTTRQSIKSVTLSSPSMRSHDSAATSVTFIDAEASTTMKAGDSVHATRFVTSVESQTRTLTLTTTKVYYTRDSPLTITSVLTTVIPPKTFVSTIIGSRTILGTAAEAGRTQAPSEVVEGSTKITTTTLIFNSITTTVVRTLVIPTDIQPSKSAGTSRVAVTKSPGSARPTRKPLSSVRTTAKPTPAPLPVIKSASTPRKRQPLPKPIVPPELLHPVPVPGKPNSGKSNLTASRTPVTTRVMPIADIDECAPACNAANMEICVEREGKYKCDCRPGYARKDGVLQCKETNNYVLLVRVMKAGEEDVSFKKDFGNKESNEFKKLAKLTEEEVRKAYSNSDIKNNYLGADVTRIVRSYDDEDGVLVNLTLRVMNDGNVSEDLLRDELSKSLEDSESLPTPAFITAEVEDVMDLDECSQPDMNDCSPAAQCINEPGSYTCKCRGIFADLDPTNPGRSCSSEVKMCDLCNGRGDCFRDESGENTSCKCHRMYLGRYCEINGILLATLLPVAAILSIISVCCIVYCCRKYRKRSTISKGFRNMTQFGPPTIGAGTLDRKAMLGQETSSENSDHFRGNPYDGPAQTSMDPDSNGSTPRRQRLDPSLDRCLGTNGGAYPAGVPPQVVIPRARHANQADACDLLSDPASRSKFGIRTESGEDDVVPCSQAKSSRISQERSSRHKKRQIQADEVSVRSKGSKFSCIQTHQGDLMNFYAPDETTSVYSKATSAIVPQACPKRRGRPGMRGSGGGWVAWNDGRDRSPNAPVGRSGRRDGDRFRNASEAARSCNESIQFPPTTSRSRFGSEVNGQSYAKGWRGNMIPERAESELSCTTSFLGANNGRSNRYPFAEDATNERKGFFPASNWGTLPYGEDE